MIYRETKALISCIAGILIFEGGVYCLALWKFIVTTQYMATIAIGMIILGSILFAVIPYLLLDHTEKKPQEDTCYPSNRLTASSHP